MYANLSWTPEDVQTLAPTMTLQEAETWLQCNEKHIRDRLCELGWGVIETLLQIDGIDLSSLQTFEITAAGFSAEDDSTDDRVYWVKAESREQVEKAIADTSALFHDTIDGDSDIDFVLPRDTLALQESLLEWASHERNKTKGG